MKGVNLAVKKNSIHTIIGVNGTGKTTLASLIMGLEGYIVKSGKILLKVKTYQSYRSQRGQRKVSRLAGKFRRVLKGLRLENI